MRLHKLSLILLVASIPATAFAADGNLEDADNDELAMALANPLAALISVPIQYNYAQTFGDNGYRHTVNLQPVAPISISEDWNLISRTIIPIISQKDVIPGTRQSGLGDIVQTAFFSPKLPTDSGVVWGVGPAALIPSGSSDFSADTWAAGPSVVILKQKGAWTYGALASHLVDVAGGNRRADISTTFVQPFMTVGLGQGRSVGVSMESAYDWERSQWNVPLNVTYSQVTNIGSQLISYGVGARAELETPQGGPDWGVRLVLTLLYPR